ncbi:MAG: DUF4105 domain-containing protein [Dinoroseobacter sp.]|nr:DUF4105 domain-containing protein [Dinoroseobacter sp.]
MFRAGLKLLAGLVFVLAVSGATIWGVMALWFRGPEVEWARYLLCGSLAVLGFSTVVVRLWSGRNRTLIPYVLAFMLLLGWWNSIDAPLERDWAPDVARQVTGTIEGDILTLENVRDFAWREGDSDQNWITSSFDLSKLQSLDLFLSYWSRPSIAHFILSFGFEGGEYLAWSIEVKREADGVYSPIADMFKSNPIVIVAATEKDVIGLRTNIRKEDVQLFRLRTAPSSARRLLEEYVRDANELSVKPRWYNSITTNCTTVVFKMLDAIGDAPPFDWRIIVNGYLPEFGYERGAVNTDYTIEELRDLGSVSAKGQAYTLKPGYSEAIRAGVPSP